MFVKDVLPIIGDMPLEEIRPKVVMMVLKEFEDRGALERASKARRRIAEIFKLAITKELISFNPAADLGGMIEKHQAKNYPFLTEDEIPHFNLALLGFTGSIISRYATQFLQYTALRTREMRFLKWEDIDWKNKLITIDASEMKAGRTHVVPISRQVEAILNALHPITGHEVHVFKGRNSNQPTISENAVITVIKQIGYAGRASGHGFRHQFSTVMNEHEWSHDAIERQLAHVDKNSIRGVYNHAQYLDKRREMMQWWADWIDEGTDRLRLHR